MSWKPLRGLGTVDVAKVLETKKKHGARLKNNLRKCNTFQASLIANSYVRLMVVERTLFLIHGLCFASETLMLQLLMMLDDSLHESQRVVAVGIQKKPHYNYNSFLPFFLFRCVAFKMSILEFFEFGNFGWMPLF